MPRTSLDLVPPGISPEQLHSSYMGSILHQAESVSELLDLAAQFMPPVP